MKKKNFIVLLTLLLYAQYAQSNYFFPFNDNFSPLTFITLFKQAPIQLFFGFCAFVKNRIFPITKTDVNNNEEKLREFITNKTDHLSDEVKEKGKLLSNNIGNLENLLNSFKSNFNSVGNQATTNKESIAEQIRQTQDLIEKSQKVLNDTVTDEYEKIKKELELQQKKINENVKKLQQKQKELEEANKKMGKSAQNDIRENNEKQLKLLKTFEQNLEGETNELYQAIEKINEQSLLCQNRQKELEKACQNVQEQSKQTRKEIEEANEKKAVQLVGIHSLLKNCFNDIQGLDQEVKKGLCELKILQQDVSLINGGMEGIYKDVRNYALQHEELQKLNNKLLRPFIEEID